MEEDTKKPKVEGKWKNKKKIFVFLGIMVVILGIVSLVFVSGFLAFKYSSLIQNYLMNLIDQEESMTSDDIKVTVTDEESNIIQIVEEANPAVVSIAVSKLTLTQDQGLIDESNNIGTGFLVDESGVIITNQHVVSDTDSEYKVVTQDGTEYEVTEILRDDLNDVAVVKIDPGDEILSKLTLGDSDNLLVGQTVLAIGTPLGEYAGSVTTGVISGLHRSVTASSDWFGTTSKTYEDVIQTDAAVNSGNSGGPLLNSQGEVIGINFATTSGADNISFAIPINKIKSRLEEYKTYGKFIKPYLGVTYQMISEYEALYYSDVVEGALVLRVEPSSPAEEAGLQRGDIITQFGETEVDSSLAEIIQAHEVGEEVEIKAVRDGEEMTFTATLGEMD